MTQENKDLLLKDLCSRLPYGVKCKYYDCCEGDYEEGTICGFEREEYMQIDGVCIRIEEVKPYLFPYSDISEKHEFLSTCNCYCSYYWTEETFDWLNKNHIDYRGLIDKGFAIDASNLNIY